LATPAAHNAFETAASAGNDRIMIGTERTLVDLEKIRRWLHAAAPYQTHAVVHL
jgi:2-keto-3-deoxy-L-rhamnonate aldolase RhmA